jgi:hypothetical protein
MPCSATYYTDCYNGNLFIGSTAVGGVVPPVYNATAQTFAIWNPVGSPKNIVLLEIDLGYVSGTRVAGNLGLSYQTGLGAQPATGSPVTAATLVAPVNGFISAGNSSVARFAPATLTLATAASYLLTFGLSDLVTTAASTGATGWSDQWVANGRVIVAPGSGVFVTANAAAVSAYDITCYWVETPLTG